MVVTRHLRLVILGTMEVETSHIKELLHRREISACNLKVLAGNHILAKIVNIKTDRKYFGS